MVQFSNIIIGMIMMALIVTGFMVFIGDGAAKYSKTDYNSTSMIQLQSTFNDINKSAYETKDAMLGIVQEDNNPIDKVGFFFSGAYQSAKLLLKSFASLFTIGDAVIGESSFLLGGFETTLKVMLAVVVIIILVVAIVMHIVTKSDRV